MMAATATTRRREVELIRREMFDSAEGQPIRKSAESVGIDDILLYHSRYDRGVQLAGAASYHLVVVNIGDHVTADCRVGQDELNHVCRSGNITIVPANLPWSVALSAGMEQIMLAIPHDRIAAIAAQHDRKPGLKPQLQGFDPTLLSIVNEIAAEASFDQLRWHELVDEFVLQLLDRHNKRECVQPEAGDADHRWSRMNSFVRHHLARPIPIGELAALVGEPEMNFARTFRKRVGLSPHQYLLRVRLHHARGMIAAGMPLAEVSLASGFSHQSHLTNWIRRIYGTTPGRLARHRSDANVQDRA